MVRQSKAFGASILAFVVGMLVWSAIVWWPVMQGYLGGVNSYCNLDGSDCSGEGWAAMGWGIGISFWTSLWLIVWVVWGVANLLIKWKRKDLSNSKN